MTTYSTTRDRRLQRPAPHAPNAPTTLDHSPTTPNAPTDTQSPTKTRREPLTTITVVKVTCADGALDKFLWNLVALGSPYETNAIPPQPERGNARASSATSNPLWPTEVQP